MKARDILVTLVTLGGVLLGMLWPGVCGRLAPLTVPCLMALLFLSFLPLRLRALVPSSPAQLGQVALWTALKLLGAPLLFWALAAWLAPAWALPVLVLSGMSGGVSAPFFGALLGADLGLLLMVVVASSLFLPLSLPALVRLLTGAQVGVPFAQMFGLLALVLLTPLVLAALGRRLAPGGMARLQRSSFPLSLVLLLVISAAVFAPFGPLWRQDPTDFLEALALAFLLAGLYLGLALAVCRLAGGRLDALTGPVAMVYLNNVLGAVFAAHFLDTNSLLLCGCYLVPYYLALLPLRRLARRP